MDIITYALCKKFTRETVDGILAGNTDLTQYYKKGEVDNKIKDFLTDTEIADLIKDFLTADQINELIKDFIPKNKFGEDFEIETDGTVKISEDSKGLKSSVVSSLPAKADADDGMMYFVPLSSDPTKLQAFVWSKDKDKYLPVGAMEDPELDKLMLAVSAEKTDLSSVDKLYVLGKDNKAKSITYENLLKDVADNAPIDDFSPNTSAADGKHGLVPAPAKGDGIMVLTNSGWQEGEEVNGMLYSFNWNPDTANVEVAQVIDPVTGDIDPDTLQYEPIEPFKGASADDAGTYGTVPKPVPNDRNKLLRGDGTWGGVGVESINESVSTLSPGDVLYIRTESGNYKTITYEALLVQIKNS